ncbi:uncharacterized protein RHOBADRAFT_49765 [Rhodotorula graminis WP1]|uniref:Anaphase-promoting complex subunit 11 n=1 Tax=Rhodotorula graminis (strain WP1) TaxID=578459 RepID=A0A194S2P7_RHOGW|nr:uncharacterized protein RHOBADRAFT_49765 [Rhodotorula graminis WP1]KPV74799.1 hypothetical protein RHOBADRAFT_49765 [Rhodotorula graminis WP1]
MTTKRRASASPAPTAAPAERVYPVAGPASATKRLKKSDPGYEDQLPPEKRLKQFKRACPQATRERADRVFAQRFFCVAREKQGETSEQFKVLGTTGNAYTVQIDKVPSCDCPDGAKGNTCKHRLFVFLKVLQVPQSSNLWYQSALLSSELAAIFANARTAPRTAFEEGVVRRYQVATGALKPEDLEAESSSLGVKKRVPDEGDSCPICYEDYTPGSEEGLVFCLGESGCGNALHRECFMNWAKTSNPTTCPLCRQKWTDSSSATQGGNAHAGPSYTAEGYENYAAMTGISNKRDTSSYHQGPRRGRDGGWRFGYDDDWNGGYGWYM